MLDIIRAAGLHLDESSYICEISFNQDLINHIVYHLQTIQEILLPSMKYIVVFIIRDKCFHPLLVLSLGKIYCIIQRSNLHQFEHLALPSQSKANYFVIAIMFLHFNL